MRENMGLYRGKRIDGHRDNTKNGTMLYGSLFIDKNGQPKIKWYCEKYGSAMTSNVDPETVGQFSGMTDIGGKRIFEGDILKTAVTGLTSHTGVVEFADGAFGLRCTDGAAFFLCFVAGSFAIIGNVHDTPELTKEAAQ